MPQLISPSAQRPIVWEPMCGNDGSLSSQAIALDARANHILYTGTRGPGKTDCQLMRFRRRVGLGYGSAWRGVIFDREYKNLDDLLVKSKKWFPRFNDGCEWLASTSLYKWVWPTGEELLFRSIKDIGDYNDYHGHEYPYIGWNELTKYPTSELYDMLMSCNRSSFTLEKDAPRDKEGNLLLTQEIPLEMFSTCNPWGAGHNWVKDRFIDCASYGQVVRRTFAVFNPKSQKEEEIVRTQVAIFGSYKENIYLDPSYIAGMTSITDENLKAAWLDGNWDIVAGGAFDDCWKRAVHVIPRFQVPDNWYVDRSFDWGSSQPFSVGWHAEATGEEVELPSGEKFCPVKGSLILCHEWYGTKKIGTNKGLKMSGGDIAEGIRERERQLLADEWLLAQPVAGPADNQIRNVTESDNDTIEKKMADKGIRWQWSDKRKNSRKIGFELLRERMKASVTGEGPGYYVMDHCYATIATLPCLPRDEDDPDDVDSDAEDHCYDRDRYRVLKGNNRGAKQINVKWVN